MELIDSIRERDPAKPTLMEVILGYNGFHAVVLHRMNHAIWNMNLKAIARFLANLSRILTGVEIHPEAQIGKNLFIDHGTGVVIGETTRIGAGVKLYQGVTLGALSFPRNPDGTLVKGGQRHPTLGDGVTIYANATILGGQTVIGRGAVIGGNCWVTRSVPAGARITVDGNTVGPV